MACLVCMCDDILDSAAREADFQDPLLTPTVKPQQPVAPPLLIPLAASPPLCFCLYPTRSHHDSCCCVLSAAQSIPSNVFEHKVTYKTVTSKVTYKSQHTHRTTEIALLTCTPTGHLFRPSHLTAGQFDASYKTHAVLLSTRQSNHEVSFHQ